MTGIAGNKSKYTDEYLLENKDLLLSCDVSLVTKVMGCSSSFAYRLMSNAVKLFSPNKVIAIDKPKKFMPTRNDIEADIRVEALFTSEAMKEALKRANKQNITIKRTVQARLYKKEVKGLNAKSNPTNNE